MLDKQDLQAIKELIDSSITASEERTHAEFSAVRAEIKASEERTRAEFGAVRAEIKASEDRTRAEFGAVRSEIGAVRSEIGAVRSEVKALDQRTQAEFSAVRAEIGSVRSEIKAAEDRWMTFYESAIQPQLQLLAEGQQTILETLAPKSRVDALEEEVVFLKSIVKNLAQDVAELKKAE